ncbi:Sec-independent protein translocase protein TatB [Pseudomonas sp. DTU_2021_1001937_2_SI_NGA_ILE_001]|uniref:Sec-independent protein translocase protein TatB n=1 Tax=Pseudomonas sp. DTU_2021_1001937_2_SI_NGA_ILE_001 TaxID=3077589 RepID=UPI0028FC17CA|nr:Sec-independent protein translocase protein TatB [Pseudomonas sp. DTU_2021_1001937_2_SI_NGA_ILE_001]WNW12977.1 Sec-independent protein translocase protein TatB [Pseudomonas sp. DTU_2021_1001937_2_SI_NGA_ILE_001]
MFGISFSELLLVGLVALLVLGPERLPGAARTAGLWIGRLRRSFNAIKQEVEREIGADEIRRQLHNEHILSLEEEARKLFNPPQEEALNRDAAAAEPNPQPVELQPQTPAAEPEAPARPRLTLEKQPKPQAPISPATPAASTESSQPSRAP